MESSIKYWLWLSTRTGINLEKLHKVLDVFGDSPEKVYLATEEHLSYCDLTSKQQESLLDKSLRKVEIILGNCDRCGISHITWQDTSYPASLRNIPDPPLLLYMKGHLPRLEERVTIAVVGARDTSPYGISMAGKLAADLSTQGATVITGMAEGADSAAVEGVLRVGGSIVSIVAGGLDKIFPQTSEHYYRDVAHIGALLSEYPPGTPHRSPHFAYRNRLLSGISNGVLIIEAKASGGTMLTAKSAISQGRDIFVVPGDVRNPFMAGPMMLMQKHEAYPIARSQDIFQFYRENFPIRKAKAEELNEHQMNDLLQHVTQVQGEKKKRPSSSPRGNQGGNGKTQQKPETGQKKPVEPASPSGKSPVPSLKPEDQEKVLSTGKHSPEEQIILRHLEEKQLTIEELVDCTQMIARVLLTNLSNLEVEGAVVALENGTYSALVYLPPQEENQ